jgi:hypothetical protein
MCMVVSVNLVYTGERTLHSDWTVIGVFLTLDMSLHNGLIVTGEFLTSDTSLSVSVSDSESG